MDREMVQYIVGSQPTKQFDFLDLILHNCSEMFVRHVRIEGLLPIDLHDAICQALTSRERRKAVGVLPLRSLDCRSSPLTSC